MSSHLRLNGYSFKLVAAVALALGAVGVRAETAMPKKLVGITQPSDGGPRELKFEAQGTLKTVSVKPGDRVKAGQIIAAQDDRKEQAELKGLMADATDTPVKMAKVESEAKNAELKRVTKLHDSGAGNDAEFERAVAEAKYAEFAITQKQEEQEAKQAKIARQRAVIDMMKLHSPVDGQVLSVNTHEGEIADPQKPVLRIVANDPLQVLVSAQTSVSQKLKLGQKVRVSYDEKAWVDTTVSFISPQADGVDIQTVWLQMPNPTLRDAGLKVVVEVPENLANADKPAAEASAK